jgi:hypothetical protein
VTRQIKYTKLELVDDNVFAIVVSEGPFADAACDGYADLSTLLSNLSIAGALARAWHMGNRNGAAWWGGREVRLPFGPGSSW